MLNAKSFSIMFLFNISLAPKGLVIILSHYQKLMHCLSQLVMRETTNNDEIKLNCCKLFYTLLCDHKNINEAMSCIPQEALDCLQRDGAQHQELQEVVTPLFSMIEERKCRETEQ